MGGQAVFDFEQTEGLALLPLAARRALDVAGQKLSLAGWQGLSLDRRRGLVEAGSLDPVPVEAVLGLVAGADPPPTPRPVRGDPPVDALPEALAGLLGPGRPLPLARWASLRALDRYAFRHLASPGREAQLWALFDELGAPRPTHLDERGEARMVDVGPKPATARRAVASARVTMAPATLAAITEGGAPKGDAFGVARVAGIQGAKRTHELIPLCHAVALTRVAVSFEVDAGRGEVRVVVTADAFDRTGVEMEAMTGASVAALTLYDMVKGMERGVTLGPVQLELKEGGRSGVWRREGGR